jgi:hypothetical protein
VTAVAGLDPQDDVARWRRRRRDDAGQRPDAGADRDLATAAEHLVVPVLVHPHGQPGLGAVTRIDQRADLALVVALPAAREDRPRVVKVMIIAMQGEPAGPLVERRGAGQRAADRHPGGRQHLVVEIVVHLGRLARPAPGR